MDQNWFALSVRSQREDRSNDRLIDRGFETYLPKERRKSEYRSSYTVPLFPGYLFARLEIPTISIEDRGWDIYGVVGSLSVPDDAIAELRQREDSTGAVVLPRFKRGQHVQITGGQFIDQIGLYQGQDAQQRAIVLFMIVGREQAITFSPAALRAMEIQ